MSIYLSLENNFLQNKLQIARSKKKKKRKRKNGYISSVIKME